MLLSRTHLTDYLRHHAASHPDKPAVVFEGQTISWGKLWEQSEQASAFFAAALGVEKQQIVSLLLTNSPEFIINYLAILHAGHIAMPLDPAYKKMELDAIIDQIAPRLIVTDGRYKGQIGTHTGKTIMAEKVLKSAAKPGKNLRLPPEQQVASLIFTSGTTSKPKAVPNTHTNHVWNIEACSQVWDWTAEDRMLLNLPLSHMHGLVMGLSGILYHGNTLYLHQQSFDADKVLAELSSGKITLFSHVPLAYMQMLNAKGDYDLSGVRLMISGGGPLPPAVSDQFKERFGIRVVETYGTTETGRIAANHLDERLQGSPGKPLPRVDLKISAEDEILVKSPGVFPGYYHNPEATAAGRTADGYWKTGDIGQLKEGHVILKGRSQERIRKFGYSVSPRDVEWAMHQNPKIKAIQVMGRQRPGEPNDELVYFVVGDITEQEINRYCKENLLFAWRPDRIIKLASIPRTSNGKPQLSKLRELAGASA